MEEKEMTMREALNLALDEALQADDRVFLLGEDIADPGASGPTAGLSTKYGHDRVLDTPDLGGRDRRRGDRRRDRRDASGRRDHDHGFHRHRRRPADQQRRQAAVHDRGTHDGADHHPHPGLRRTGHRRDALAEPRGVVHAHSRDEGDRALHPARRQRPADSGDLRRGPLPVHRDDPAARQEGTRPRRTRILDSAWARPTSSGRAPTSA